MSAQAQAQPKSQPQPRTLSQAFAPLVTTCMKDENFLLIPLFILEMPQKNVVGFIFRKEFYQMLYLRDAQCDYDKRRSKRPIDKFVDGIFELCKLTKSVENQKDFLNLFITTQLYTDGLFIKEDCKIELRKNIAKLWNWFQIFNRHLSIKSGDYGEDGIKQILYQQIEEGYYLWRFQNPESTLFMVKSQFMQQVIDINSSCGEAGGKESTNVRNITARMKGEEEGNPITDHLLPKGTVGALDNWWQSNDDKKYWTDLEPKQRREKFLSQNPGESNPVVNYAMSLIDEYAASKKGGKRKKKTKKKRRRKKNSKKKGGRRKKSKKNRRKKKKSRRKRR